MSFPLPPTFLSFLEWFLLLSSSNSRRSVAPKSHPGLRAAIALSLFSAHLCLQTRFSLMCFSANQVSYQDATLRKGHSSRCPESVLFSSLTSSPSPFSNVLPPLPPTMSGLGDIWGVLDHDSPLQSLIPPGRAPGLREVTLIHVKERKIQTILLNVSPHTSFLFRIRSRTFSAGRLRPPGKFSYPLKTSMPPFMYLLLLLPIFFSYSFPAVPPSE